MTLLVSVLFKMCKSNSLLANKQLSQEIFCFFQKLLWFGPYLLNTSENVPPCFSQSTKPIYVMTQVFYISSLFSFYSFIISLYQAALAIQYHDMATFTHLERSQVLVTNDNFSHINEWFKCWFWGHAVFKKNKTTNRIQ